MLADDSSTTTRQESGIGDQVYWSTNTHAAQFTVQKGSVVFAVMLGGNLGDPESHKAALGYAVPEGVLEIEPDLLPHPPSYSESLEAKAAENKPSIPLA
jgi:hypothetical protein